MQPYICRDGKKHTIENKSYHFSMFPKFNSFPAMYVEKNGTVVDASQIKVTGPTPIVVTDPEPNQGFLYGAYVKDGARLNLKETNFENLSVALHAQNARIYTQRGAIKNGGIYAEGENTAIILLSIKVFLEDTEAENISIFSNQGAFISFIGGHFDFKGSGSFQTQLGGKLRIGSAYLKGEGKTQPLTEDDETVREFLEIFDISQGGDVSLDQINMQLNNRHGFFIKNFSGYADSANMLIQGEDDKDKLFKGYTLSNAFKKTNIKIEKSDISIQGKGVLGLYLDGVDPGIWANMLKLDPTKLSKVENLIVGEASVHLLQTTLSVPEGIAIYSTGFDDYGAEATIELTERARISGDLLLLADNNSSLFVKANNSTLAGDIRVEDVSIVNLELENGSSWYIRKSQYVNLQKSDSTVPSVSYISLSDSTLFFEKFITRDYQTLKIGKETNVNEAVYGAEGNSRIQMSTFMDKNGLFDSQKTDRLLIYGDVMGTTLIDLVGFSKDSENKESKGSDNSVSIIQVSGEATENSFKLLNNYTAINGSPYQYRLYAYGPGSSSGKADPKNRLLEGKGDFWDFRLKSVYVEPKLASSGSVPPSTEPEPSALGSRVEPPKNSLSSDPLSESLSHELLVSTSLEESSSVESLLAPSTAIFPQSSEESVPSIPTDLVPPPSAESGPLVSDSSVLVPPLSEDSTSNSVPPVLPKLPLVPTVSEGLASLQPISVPLPPAEELPSELSDLADSLSTESTDFSLSVSVELESSEPYNQVDTSSTDSALTPSTPVASELPSTSEKPSSAQPIPAPTIPAETPTEMPPYQPSDMVDSLSKDSAPFISEVPEESSFVQSAPVPPAETPSEVLLSKSSDQVLSSSREAIPSAPEAPEESSAVQPMPAPTVLNETPAEMPTSNPEDSLSKDSVSVSSVIVEQKSSAPPSSVVSPFQDSVPSPPVPSEVLEEPSSIQPISVSVPSAKAPVEVPSSKLSDMVVSSSTDSVSVSSAIVEQKPSEPSASVASSFQDSLPSAPVPSEVLEEPSSAQLIPESPVPVEISAEEPPSKSSDLADSSPIPPVQLEPKMRAVVPQLPTYLLLSNALFHAGVIDLITQNKKLERMRRAFHSSWKVDENAAFFLRTYERSHHYTSNLSALEYGYGAELDYSALEAGVLLKEAEYLDNRTFFGVLGSYGSLSLHPLDVEYSKKSPFERWSMAAYGSMRHDTGFYMDGVLSYGLFRGDVLTFARGKVVTLRGKQLSGSLTTGIVFTIGHKGVVFDPQIQVIYQHLQFNRVHDVDNLDVDLGKRYQWGARVGGHLNKTISFSEEEYGISFYSKLYFLQFLENRQFVSFQKDFQLGAFGSSLEAGIGFNARLSSKLGFDGDVTYQHKLTKAGFSGTKFRAVLHYDF
ncbi:autotransporter outer membrane beta-barrel domain-containing protein [Bartonella rattaustraliani]|uniref:autotransporter outer membrane beta-barrel domain-containing protein n=1 Tax=Bartonella rattaustraliani TaxID=481139 RepID=UPI00178C1F2B|nr:autotransporter outer membrane beta-barrel domain-containing protein [Bartonella rattaustraliani]